MDLINFFENQFFLIEKMLLRFYFNGAVDLIRQDGSLDYEAANRVTQQIRGLISNELTYVDNVFLVSENRRIVVEKDGISSLNDTFSKYYASPDYGTLFWEQQFQAPYHFNVFPASRFYRVRFDLEPLPLGQLMPVIVKNEFNKQFFVVAMLDVAKMVNDYRLSVTDEFYMLGADGGKLWGSGTLFADGSNESGRQSNDLPSSNYLTVYDEVGSVTGLRYVNVLSNKELHVQVNRLILYVCLIALPFALGSFLIFFRFGRNVHRPLQKIVQAVQKLDPSEAITSNIREFEILNMQIGRILRMNRELVKNLQYLHKIKNIYPGFQGGAESDAEKPFYFALFKLHYTLKFEREIRFGKEKATYAIKELIQSFMAEHFPDSATVQVESDMIIALLYCESSAPFPLPLLKKLLNQLKTDRDYCIVTVACEKRIWDAGKWNVAYEKHTKMLQYRLLEPKEQIVTELPADYDAVSFLSPAQEEELQTMLKSGNASVVIPLVLNITEAMHKKGAPVAHFYRLAENVFDKVMKELVSLQIDLFPYFADPSYYDRIRQCCSLEEYQTYMRDFLATSLQRIRQKRERNDNVVSYVLQYIDEHYANDISLEQIADKLGLSRNYLSTYFREKTGCTFSEYVNERRISQAKQMLLDGKYKVHDIALMVGYQNTNSFIRMFRKKLGVPPGEYRKSLNLLGDRKC